VCSPISTACCANATPQNLTGTVSFAPGLAGDCACMPSEIAFTYNPATTRWEGTVNTCGGGACEGVSTLYLECDGATWRYMGDAPIVADCDPFFLEFQRTLGAGAYTMSFTE
jgi:hypothetical protein